VATSHFDFSGETAYGAGVDFNCGAGYDIRVGGGLQVTFH